MSKDKKGTDDSFFDDKWWEKSTPDKTKKDSSSTPLLDAANNDDVPQTPVSPVDKVRYILHRNQSELGENVNMSLLGQHALFCQMDVLSQLGDNQKGWKESARWLKYEERLEEANRWSKPHVPTPSLHSLFNLRKSVADGSAAVVLEVDAADGSLQLMSENLVKALVDGGNLSAVEGQRVLELLIKPHKHKHRKGTPARGSKIDRKSARQSSESTGVEDVNGNANKISDSKSPASGSLGQHKTNKKLQKKIARGAEAANILVGQVDFLSRQFICIARLSDAAVVGDLTEVAIPTRFLVLILGPDGTSVEELAEIGRASAGLFTDKVFSEVAYSAEERQEVLDGIDEYIDGLNVLPPSIWDPANRLGPPDNAMPTAKVEQRLNQPYRRHPSKPAEDEVHSSEDEPGLQRTGRFFGGIIADIKRRYPLYWSDIKDGFNLQCLASVVFLYFACITPIVTFGALLGIATEGYMGAMETMVAGTICGIIFHSFSGQPLNIVGATGPLLVLEGIIYQVCSSHDVEFLPFRCWVGIWAALIIFVVAAFDLSYLVVYITRFTEESFAVLISAIFIMEAIMKCLRINEKYPVHFHAVDHEEDFRCYCMQTNTTDDVNIFSSNSTQVQEYLQSQNWTDNIDEHCVTATGFIEVAYGCINETACRNHSGWELDGPACFTAATHAVPDVFMFSFILFIGTFSVALGIKDFKNSSFFPNVVRSTLSDYAVFLSIVLWTSIDLILGIATPKLDVPNKLANTRSDRQWLVNPFSLNPVWMIALALVPAFLATVLIILDQQITAVIVNRKEHKLKKGFGYHLDLLVLSITVTICSFLGLPWFVAATVRSITHVRSLLVESEVRAPGDKIQMLGVREQRLTGICIHILIGISVYATQLLKHVPMPVLYGVFMYMGWTSLRGVQFVDRVLIMFMPEKYQPDRIFLRHVPTTRVHIFTIIQLICMVAMYTVKSIKTIAITFPLLILALCFVRKAMDCFFTQSELFWLDHLLPDQQIRDKEDKEKNSSNSNEKVPLDEDNNTNGGDLVHRLHKKDLPPGKA